MKYLLFQVGCIECGVSSFPVSIHESLEDAKAAQERHPSTWETEGGDGYSLIIDIENCKEVEL